MEQQKKNPERERATLCMLSQPFPCTRCDATTWVALDIGYAQFEPRCPDHLPPGEMERWMRHRLAQMIRDGDAARAVQLVGSLLIEARSNERQRCADVAHQIAGGIDSVFPTTEMRRSARMITETIEQTLRRM